VNSARQQHRHQRLQFAVSHQGISANDGQVQGSQTIDDFDDAINQFLPLAIVQRSQRYAAS
jgi:hypothetical protein